MAHRLYNEMEIGAMIHRATELHEEAMGASEGGLSLEEIERIAAELGLPPEHVKAAALELEERASRSRASGIWGGPFVLDQARIVDGQITKDQWEQVVLELRKSTGSPGRISEFGRVREWTRTKQDMGYVLERTMVTARAKDGQTSIRVQKYYGGGALMAYVAAFALSATATGIALDGGGLPDLVNLAVFFTGGVGGLAAVRASVTVWARRQKERLNRLTEVLHRTVSADSSPVPATADSGTSLASRHLAPSAVSSDAGAIGLIQGPTELSETNLPEEALLAARRRTGI